MDKNYLTFNGKSIYFMAADGQYWIAIKPICEALGVNFDRQYKNIKKDKILASEYAIQPIQVPNDQLRNFVCLPEIYIYGWVFSIRSESTILLKYKKKVYNILYDYFKGTLTRRQELLMQKTEEIQKINILKTELKENDTFRQLQELEQKQRKYPTLLKDLDKDLLQLNLF